MTIERERLDESFDAMTKRLADKAKASMIAQLEGSSRGDTFESIIFEVCRQAHSRGYAAGKDDADNS